jgi:hypothetical protein
LSKYCIATQKKKTASMRRSVMLNGTKTQWPVMTENMPSVAAAAMNHAELFTILSVLL